MLGRILSYLFILLVAAILLATSIRTLAREQGATFVAGQVLTISTAALPATCSVGQVYIRTASAIAFSFCTATDTWSSVFPYTSGSGDTTTIGGGLTVNGVQTCTSANCSLSLSTPIVYCDATSNSVSLNLPDASSGAAFYSIQRIDNTAANTCTLDGDSSDTINGNATYLVAPDVSYSLIGRNTSSWRITASFLPSVPAEVNLGTVGSTETIDFASNYRGQYRMTLDENLTLTFSNPIEGASYTLFFTQDGSGTNTVTWPAAVVWSDGSAPTITATADKTTLCVLTYSDASTGNKYFGACNLNY